MTIYFGKSYLLYRRLCMAQIQKMEKDSSVYSFIHGIDDNHYYLIYCYASFMRKPCIKEELPQL